jgi:hypothetical protein
MKMSSERSGDVLISVINCLNFVIKRNFSFVRSFCGVGYFGAFALPRIQPIFQRVVNDRSLVYKLHASWQC